MQKQRLLADEIKNINDAELAAMVNEINSGHVYSDEGPIMSWVGNLLMKYINRMQEISLEMVEIAILLESASRYAERFSQSE